MKKCKIIPYSSRMCQLGTKGCETNHRIILIPGHHTLTIRPAIYPDKRHQIEDCLKKMGFKIRGGGTDTNLTSCDISFE